MRSKTTFAADCRHWVSTELENLGGSKGRDSPYESSLSTISALQMLMLMCTIFSNELNSFCITHFQLDLRVP